jgi:hypothetical protein
MTISGRQNLDLVSSLTVIRDADCNATPTDNVNAGAAVIYLIEANNSTNPSSTVWLKLYNSLNPTIGTTAPDMTFPIGGGDTFKLAIPEGISFGTGLSFACVSNGGGTAGGTGPTNDVEVTLVIS